MRIALALAIVCVCAPSARANGRPAATLSIEFDAARPERVLVSTTFGLLVSDDGGVHWRWVCETALETAGAAVDPIYRATAADLLLQGHPGGVLFSRDGGCGWSEATGLPDASVQDVAVSPADPLRVLAAGEVNAGSGVFVSQNGGTSFAAPSALLPNVALRGLRFADATTVWLLAHQPQAMTAQLYKSTDAGGSFAPAGSTTVTGAPRLRVSAGGVYILAGPSLYRSTDGGATIAHVTDFGALYDGAFADDGTLYVATDQGVRHSADGTMFSAASGPVVTCLNAHAGALWACASEAAAPFSVGISTDGGATWTPRLRFAQDLVGPLECPESTTVCVDCYVQWPTLAAQFGLPDTTQPMCLPEPDAGVDAAPDAPAMMPAPPASGCGCQVGGRGSAGSGILLALFFRRRSRR